MVRQVASIVRASALRSRVFILAKACSMNAHTGYFVNPTVMDMLICGMDNGVPRPCPPKASP